MVTAGGLRGLKASFLPDMVSNRTRGLLKRSVSCPGVPVFVFEPGNRPRLGLFYERGVTSFDDLVKAAKVLDEDSGIRLAGVRNGRKCLVFVTRFGESFTMMTYSMVRKTGEPGRRLGVAEFDGVDALVEALRKAAPGPVRAYVY